MAGELCFAELVEAAQDGFFFPLASRGSLDPLTGRFELSLEGGRRIRDGSLGDAVGCGWLRGTVSDLLGAIRGIGRERETAGAGWCAKGGVRLPVWATAPAILLDRRELEP